MSANSGDADFAALYDHAACGLLITSDDGVIRHANSTFCQWLGYRGDELAGRTRLQDLLTMGGRIFHQTHWAPLLQMQGSIAEVKFEMIHRDGHTLPAIMNALRRGRAPDVRHEIAVFIAEDRQRYEHEFIAARKRAENLLAREREAQRELTATQEELKRQRQVAEDRAAFAEQMIGIVSHDLRNPLMAISTSIAVLASGDLNPAQSKAVQAIGRAVARSNRLIQDLLDMSRVRIGGGLRIEPCEIELHQLVSSTLDELRLAHPGRELVHQSLGDGRVVADADRLAQLLGNLITNAVAYGSADGPVTVTTRVGGSQIELAVHNIGTPIPAAALPTLFDALPHWRSGDSPRRVGFGLFIVREIARAHGGDARVESSPETGTRFRVVLPTLALGIG